MMSSVGGSDPDDYCGDANSVCNDFWRLDTTTFVWQQVMIDGVQPQARAGHSMVFDESRNKIILLNGSSIYSENLVCANQPLNDLWEWDGSDWENIDVSIGPGFTVDHAMVYDTNMQSNLLFGGRDLSSNSHEHNLALGRKQEDSCCF